MKKQFEKSAYYYDIFYKNRAYSADVETIEKWIDDVSPGSKMILDIACGSHEHLRYFDSRYQVDGFDNNQDFLEIAVNKRKSCQVKGQYFLGSMDDFQLEGEYDVIMCLFSSIGYLSDGKALAETIRCFAKHLTADGMIIIEPWISPDSMDSFPPAQLIQEGDIHISRMSSYAIDGDSLKLFLHYLVQDQGEISYFSEEHNMCFFDSDQYKDAFEQSNLVWAYDPLGLSSKRGLYVAAKNANSKAGDALRSKYCGQ